MSKHVVAIETKAKMDEIMAKDSGPAMIDFWASWCGPCRAMAPNYAAVAEEYADEPIQFYKVDTENYPELSQAFGVKSLPTVMMVNEGEILDAMIGSQSGQTIAKRASWLLSKSRGEGFLKRLFS